MKKLYSGLRNIARECVYGLSSVMVFASGAASASRNMLGQIKNKHNGKRCFIVGNGPSLTPEDLDLLKGEVTFASNKIYRIFDKTDWRPTYYAIFDESVARDQELIENINHMACEMKFFREQGWYVYHKLRDGCYIHSWHSRALLDVPHFSEELTEGIYTIATVTYSMIQIAHYMGFSEIYLIGMDNRYAYMTTRDGRIVRNEGVISYFGEQQDQIPPPTFAPATWEMDVTFDYAEQYSRSNGFRIFNVTRGGFLEAFERKNLEDILNI